MTTTLPKIICLVGPTAVGKTAISMQLAHEFGGEIVNADAAALYRYMDIGTAKPGAQARGEIRHHLLDIVNPDEMLTLAEFKNLAYQTFDDILARGHVPIVVGGSGLYVTALFKGYTIPEVPPDYEFRKQLEQEVESQGGLALHQRLAQVDPEAASKIDYRNTRRVIRALEVYHLTNTPISILQQRVAPPYEFILVGLTREREELVARIRLRIEQMLEAGFIGEVEKLLAAGYKPELFSMAAIGYRQIAAYLRGESTLDEAKELMQTLTVQLMAHQKKWFRASDPNIFWVNAADPHAYERIREYLRAKAIPLAS